ncbi:ethionine resistance-conferring protein 1 [Diutina catenulata]
MSQFTHSNTARRGSVVYGSVGKGALFLPEDFVDVDATDDEESALLSRQTSHHLSRQSSRRQSQVHPDILASERSLLADFNIPPPSADDAVESVFSEALAQHKLDETTSKIEIRALVRAAVPLVATFVLQNSLSTVSVFTVGHLGAAELAAVSMGAMTANITGYATIQGIATALDTLCPQAFGAENYTMVGRFMQKCIAIIFVVMMPVLAVWVFFGDALLSLVVPDRDTAHLAAVYLRTVAPGIPAYILFECGKRFLQAQGIYHVSTMCLLVAAPLNLFLNVTLVNWMGYVGAPTAVAITYWVMAASLFIITVWFVPASSAPTGLAPMTCWPGLNVADAFSHWRRLIYLAIPGLIMLEAEFLAFEIMTLMASRLGTYPLAAQSIGATLASLTYQVPFAVGIAGSTRIANYLGAGLAPNAKRATSVALGSGLCVAAFNWALVFYFRWPIAALFTDDERVIEVLHNVIWLIALMQVVDAMNAVSAGCLRGQGQTKVGGIVNLFAYYVVGLPLSIWLTFYSPWKGNLEGLWAGCVAALVIIAGVQSWYALGANFNRLVDLARLRGAH